MVDYNLTWEAVYNIVKEAIENHNDWLFVDNNYYKVIKCTPKEYELVKDKNIKTLISLGLESEKDE